MALFLYTVRMRRIANGADFVLDRIEAGSAEGAEEFAYHYLAGGFGLRRTDYTAHAERKQEIMEVK